MSTIKLLQEHLAALARQRRTVVNLDTGCRYAPLLYDGVEPDQVIEYHHSLLDAGGHAVDSVWWNFNDAGEAPYPSKVLPAYRLRKYVR